MTGLFKTITEMLDGVYQISTATLQRPNDAPGVYHVNDEFNTSIAAPTYVTFEDVVRIEGGKGVITSMMMSSNSSAMTSQIRWHLYKSPPTPCGDHTPFKQMWADDANYIGYIDMGYRQFAGAGSDMVICQITNLNMEFECVAGSKDIYGRAEVIVVGAAPIANQILRPTIKTLVN